MNISFGSKNPISRTQIYNKQTQEFEPATLYEYDGRSPDDAEDFALQGGCWQYKVPMAVALLEKSKKLSRESDLSEFEKALVDGTKVYTLETEDGDTAAMCYTKGVCNTANIQFLEGNPQNIYGLAGQAILASIMEQMIKKPDAHLMVLDPALSAMDFYKNSCGFEERTTGSHDIEIYEDGMRGFVDKFEQTSGSLITDIETKTEY